MRRKAAWSGVIVSFALCLCLIFVGAALSQPQKPAQATIELTFNHFIPSVGLVTNEYRKWGDMIEKRSNGRLKIKWFWSNSLFTQAEALMSVKAGMADMGVTSGAYNPTQMPTVLALEHAYNASDLYAGVRSVTGLFKKYPEMEEEFENNGVKRICPSATGVFQWFQKGSWASSADFKNIVARTMGGGRAEWLKKLGVNPIFMPISEVYEAMERGAIAGFENTLSLADDLKQNEVTGTLAMLNSGVMMSGSNVMNLKKFNSLPSDLQKVLIDTGLDWVENSLCKALIEREQGIQKAWTTKGVKVVTPKPNDLVYIKKVARETALDFAKKQDLRLGTPGKTEKVLKALWEIVDEAESIVAKKKYPWT